MTTRTAVTLFAATMVLIACSRVKRLQPASRVSYFHYGGYGDTLYATLNGQVVFVDTSIQSKDSLAALAAVTISIAGYDRVVTSDRNGQFVINLGKGVFSLQVNKGGFQPLLIKNYVSNPDQFSAVKICLEKGREQQVVVIPAGGIE